MVGRNGITGQKRRGSKATTKWMDSIEFKHGYDKEVYEEYVATKLHSLIREMERRVKNLTERIIEVAKTKRYAAKVKKFRSLHGVDYLIALAFTCEIGDFEDTTGIHRFGSAKQFMSYLGLVPTESSSGSSRRQGGITKAGSGNYVTSSFTEIADRKRVDVCKVSTRRKHARKKMAGMWQQRE